MFLCVRLLALLTAVLLFATPLWAQRAWETPGEADARTARELAQMGRCSEALAAFDRAIAQRQKDPTLRRDRGLCHDRLGNPQPAIEDYRAYLSMAPSAPDATMVRDRLAHLEATHKPEPEPVPVPEPEVDTAQAKPAEEAPEVLRDSEPAPKKHVPDKGWLIGLFLGARGWPKEGFPGATTAFGLEAGYAYNPSGEVDVRATLVRTREVDASGFGFSAQHAWRIRLASKRGEFLVPVGLGIESQRDDLRRTVNFYFARVSPAFRWAVMPKLVLQGGPEFGVGRIPVPKEVSDPDAEARTALFIGGHVSLLWVIAK